MRVDVDVSGFDEVAENIAALSAGLMEAARKGLKAGMLPMVADAKMRVAPTDNSTGQLRNSIGADAVVQGAFVVGDFHASAEYALYVEMGTGPEGEADHAGINPDEHPTYTLHGWTYKDPRSGEFFYTTGQPARPYMYPALKAGEGKLSEAVREAILKAYKG